MAVWVMDEASVPVIVTVYIPFAAVGVAVVGGDEVELPPPPAQPDTAMPITTRMHAAAITANLCERRPSNANKTSPVIAIPACTA